MPGSPLSVAVAGARNGADPGGRDMYSAAPPGSARANTPIRSRSLSGVIPPAPLSQATTAPSAESEGSTAYALSTEPRIVVLSSTSRT